MYRSTRQLCTASPLWPSWTLSGFRALQCQVAPAHSNGGTLRCVQLWSAGATATESHAELGESWQSADAHTRFALRL